MATTVIAVGTMKVAQVPVGANFQIVERAIPNRVRDRCGLRCRLAAFATVTRSRKKAYGQEFSIPSSRTRSGRHY